MDITQSLGLTPEDKEYAEGFIKGFTENFTRTYKESCIKIQDMDIPESKKKEILTSMEEKFEQRLRESLKESLVKVLDRRDNEEK